MRGMKKGGGGGVAGIPPHVTAWEGTLKALEMEGRGYGGGRRGKATDIPDRVTQGGGQRRVQWKGVRRGQGHGRRCGFTSWRRHVRDIVIILEEVNLPHPICTRCDMFVPRRDLKGRHKNTDMCRGGADKKRRRLAEAEVRDSAEMAFKVCGEQIQTVPRFKYLGRILTA